ncbi:hypothetical protein D9619_007587 [Psilocybe cf. subviscida]|uniref:Uncharacterized protein n=1 Tax=Psilocybe cf. subviscida TaxID=2480587 RepID=A0A8H5B245_9AGAR|nr:hypothetical protein D9619_007587 [Psilocybe cf. subviscida]
MSLPTSRVHDVIDSSYNSILLETFLCGLYTVIFGYTLRLLLQKGKKRISATLTLLWVIVMITFSLDYWYHRAAFVNYNSSPLEIANFIQRVSPQRVDQSLFTADDMLSVSSNWLADAILIWRCYVLWESRRWMLLPLPVLFVGDIVIPCVLYFSPFANNQRLVNTLLLAFFAVSTVITVIGTSLIILRILVVAVEDPRGTRRSVYRNIQRIIVESGIVYSAAMVLAGISIFLGLTQRNETIVYMAGQCTMYFESALVPLSGLGPTLIAARVAHETSEYPGNRSHAISHLTFRRSTRRNDTFSMDTDLDRFSHMRFENMGVATQEHNQFQGPTLSNVRVEVGQDHDEKSCAGDSAGKIA